MEEMKDMEEFCKLPELPYGYKDLEPNISEKQLTIHHKKHHAGYVKKANAILEALRKARKENSDIDMKSTLKSLSFNVGGHVLHSLFWRNLSPSGGGEPQDELKSAIIGEFGSFERFKKEFSEASASVEGSGWAALMASKKTKRLLIAQIEKHNVNFYPNFEILMVLDVWEHAFYIDYQNEKAKFINAFWQLVNWKEVDKRFKEI